jgi:hypothetical protein
MNKRQNQWNQWNQWETMRTMNEHKRRVEGNHLPVREPIHAMNPTLINEFISGWLEW